jgi:hypothetical protein
MLIEQELIDATRFDMTWVDYELKQEYLTALARAVAQLSDEEFDKLSPEAADWANEAARAIKARKFITDFDGETEVTPENDPFDAVGAESGNEIKSVESVATALVSEPEAPTKVKKPRSRKAGTGGKKAKKEVKVETDVLEVTQPVQVNEVPQGAYDRFKVAIGTKSHHAVNMFLQGCRMSEVHKVLGDNYYNLLRRMTKEGHRVSKVDGVIKLTHKDDVVNTPAIVVSAQHVGSNAI